MALALGRHHEKVRAPVLESFVHSVFDPVWNATHRVQIWGTIVTVLFLSGFGFPLPEDIPLILAGFTTYKQAGDEFVFWHYVVAFATVTTPILLGDLVAYAMGRRWGWALRRFRIFARLITDARMERVQRWYEEYGSFTVFLGRQVAGVRFVTFYTAGTMRMNVGKFVFWDFIGCLVSVPVWLALGRFAAQHGEAWMEAASSTVGKVFLGIVALLALGLYLWSRRQRARGAPPATTTAPPTDAPAAPDAP